MPSPLPLPEQGVVLLKSASELLDFNRGEEQLIEEVRGMERHWVCERHLSHTLDPYTWCICCLVCCLLLGVFVARCVVCC